MATVIHAQGLTKRYGDFEAVRGIDFTVEEQTCFGILGPNGAGKSTTIRMVSCLSPLTSGRLEVLGLPAHPDNLKIKRQLGIVSQEDNLDNTLTVLENVEIHGRFYGLNTSQSRRRALDLLDFLQLTEKAQEYTRQLSGGMRRRLVIARALIGQPKLLIMDEPTTGLDPQARVTVWKKLRELQEQGVTILLTTHYMEEAERLADRLIVMDHGRILEQGTPRDLIARVVGKERLELGGTDERIRNWVTDHRLGSVEIEGDTLVIFCDQGDVVLEHLKEAHLLPKEYRRSSAGLDDVFMRLTGRDLRE